MKLLRPLQRLVPPHLGREYAIRCRLLRSSLSGKARRAERRADTLLISYPKCGRTWLTMLLSRVLAEHAGLEEEELDYLATDVLDWRIPSLPRIRISHDDDPHWKTPRGLERSKRHYREKRVILLVRDPRDVVVSMYFERTRRERAFAGNMNQFLHARRGSLDTILAYYNVWASQRAWPRSFLQVHYENLRDDTARELRRVLDFLGLHDVSDVDIESAVDFASFENMHAMESHDALGSGRLRPRDRRDPESFKTRRGKVGAHVDYLTDAEIAWMERRIHETLDPIYGYAEPSQPAGARRRQLEQPSYGGRPVERESRAAHEARARDSAVSHHCPEWRD
jgi:sulfotransferase family protein